MPTQPEPRITVTPAHVETALRDWLAHFDYDQHKATECGEEDGADTYPDEAAEFFAALAAAAEPESAVADAHPAEHTWAAELHDPLADEWVPGTRYIDRERAVNHLSHAAAIGPTWKDGTPTQRRLVRASTTYTVEPTP